MMNAMKETCLHQRNFCEGLLSNMAAEVDDLVLLGRQTFEPARRSFQLVPLWRPMRFLCHHGRRGLCEHSSAVLIFLSIAFFNSCLTQNVSLCLWRNSQQNDGGTGSRQACVWSRWISILQSIGGFRNGRLTTIGLGQSIRRACWILSEAFISRGQYELNTEDTIRSESLSSCLLLILAEADGFRNQFQSGV